MATVFLICGKICAGKSTYAQALRKQSRAVLLSCDEITLALFDGHIGSRHDEMVERTQRYLLQKSLEVLEADVSVILDWGFWTRKEREEVKAFYRRRGIPFTFHFVHVSDSVWQANLRKRNQEIVAKRCDAYYIDPAVADKFSALFEPPTAEEMDVWYETPGCL